MEEKISIQIQDFTVHFCDFVPYSPDLLVRLVVGLLLKV
jgi:hypothetical protein